MCLIMKKVKGPVKDLAKMETRPTLSCTVPTLFKGLQSMGFPNIDPGRFSRGACLGRDYMYWQYYIHILSLAKDEDGQAFRQNTGMASFVSSRVRMACIPTAPAAVPSRSPFSASRRLERSPRFCLTRDPFGRM